MTHHSAGISLSASGHPGPKIPICTAPPAHAGGLSAAGDGALRAPEHRGRHFLHLGAVYFLALALTATLLQQVVPQRRIPTVSAKLEELRGMGENIDVLFVGTSRVHHQIIPSLFDHLTALAGHPTHSFNLGVDGLRTPEDYYLLEQALSGRKRPLRWIVLELKDINFLERDVDGETARGPYWHDSTRMWILTRRFFSGCFIPGLTGKQRLRSIRDDARVWARHCYLWLENELSVGNLSERERGWATPNLGPVSVPSQKSVDDGYLSEGNPPVEAHELSTYTQKFKELKRHPASTDYGDFASQRLLRREQALAAQHGAQLVLLVPPTLKDSKFLPDPARGPAPMLLDLDRPAEFPELFDIRNRRDETHLNERGAEVFTRIIAQRLNPSLPAVVP